MQYDRTKLARLTLCLPIGTRPWGCELTGLGASCTLLVQHAS